VTLAPEEIKFCCASAYGTAAARFLLGDSFHPGGVRMTSRLVQSLGVGGGDTVVDVASGLGTSALQLARETGCSVIGIDLSEESVAAAERAAQAAGLQERVRFAVGDAEALPLDDWSVDGALCECALCTFPGKRAAARELARVLRPGTRLGLSDVVAVPERLPPELRSLQARVACIADARPLADVVSLLEANDFAVEELEQHDAELAALLDRIDLRLGLVRLVGGPDAGDALQRGRRLLHAARAALAERVLGYAIVVARRQ
jgi:ubiquinone/menaquinone biosynthesis C-methylase UbiE